MTEMVRADAEWQAICDSYAAENQRFSDEIDRLQAEAERLRMEVSVRGNMNEGLRADNAKMRQVLNDILTDDFEYNLCDRIRAILASTAAP